MSVQTVSVMVPPLRAVPRGAGWIGDSISNLSDRLGRLGALLRAWVAAVGAQSALDRAARRDARSREDLLVLARRYESTQPEFAKDLFAAAANDRGR
jgi:MoxR-like ATPase